MENGSARSLLLALAEAGEHRLEQAQENDLQTLLGLGLIKPTDPPRADSLDRKYDDLQGRHRQLLEAKALTLRLFHRMAPRSGLGRWLPGGIPKPLAPDDEDLGELHGQLAGLSLEIREVAKPHDLLPRLKHVQDRLLVEDRDCLDRMADIDRDLEACQKRGSTSVRVDPFGWVSLTAAGERELPEWSALQDLEAVFNLVSGPRRQKIDDYALFRHDPSALLAVLMENPHRRENLAEAVSNFETLAEPFARHTSILGIRSTRQQNAFLIRLIRLHRDDPKAPFAWANRERLWTLSEQALKFLPASMTAEGWPLIYGLDVLVAGRPEVALDERRAILESILKALAAAFPAHPARDGQGLRLAFAMLHAVLERRVAAPVFVERFLKVIVAAIQEGRQAAPLDLPDEGSRLIFAYHLAHMAEFIPARIPDLVNRFQRLESALGDRGRLRTTPVQVLLHGMLTLERLERRGAPTAAEEYAATFLRVRTWIDKHKDLGRAFHTEHSRAEDDSYLAANVTARAFFSRAIAATPGKLLADVGVAAAYEAPDRNAPPLLGQPFGTLMVQ
jgi:hypothetical protein